MTSTQGTTDALINAEINFGLNLIRQLPASGQVVVSPLSIILALSVVRAGAKGETKAQISRAISEGIKDEESNRFFSKLAEDVLGADDGVRTTIANAFFIDKRFEINQLYSETIVKEYSARVETLNFEHISETAKTINTFVNETTAGEIQSIVTEDMVKDTFSLVINAIYFTAKWEHKFDRWLTVKDTFFSTETERRRTTCASTDIEYLAPRDSEIKNF